MILIISFYYLLLSISKQYESSFYYYSNRNIFESLHFSILKTEVKIINIINKKLSNQAEILKEKESPNLFDLAY